MLEEIIIGNSVTEIIPRNFVFVSTIKRVVLPASLISLPETSLYSEARGAYEPQTRLFENSTPDIFMYITEEQLAEMIIPMKTRDEGGNVVKEEEKATTTYGYVEGWCASSKLYFLGEWHYDEDGKPVPNS